MPLTSNDRPSLSIKSVTSPGANSALCSMAQDCLTSDSTQSWLTQLPPEMLRFLVLGGAVVISKREGLIYATLMSPPPTKAGR